MGFLNRLFGKKATESESATADRARSQQLAGRETGQTAEAQAGTRARMEADLAGQRQRREGGATSEVPPCPHTTLVSHWDSVADMGKEDKVTSYRCDSCEQEFTAEEGRRLRETEAERVQRELATPDQT